MKDSFLPPTSLAVTMLLMGQVDPSLGSTPPVASFDPSACAWTYLNKSSFEPLENQACTSEFQTYISTEGWLAGEAFYAYCNSQFKVTVRKNAKSSYESCATSKYIGISNKLFYCGSYAEVARWCGASRPGYVIINREKFDAGILEVTACPLVNTAIAGSTNKRACGAFYDHSSDGDKDCPVPQPSESSAIWSFNYDSSNCAWNADTGCTLPALGECSCDEAHSSWISPVAWREGDDFFMYCSAEDRLIEYRHGANKNVDNCATAEYIGVSSRLFFCGSLDYVRMYCNRGDGYVIIKRESIENDPMQPEIIACPITKNRGICPNESQLPLDLLASDPA